MLRDSELDVTKNDERSTYLRVLDAWEKFDEASKKVSLARKDMESAQIEEHAAKEKMQIAYREMMEQQGENNIEAWNEYFTFSRPIGIKLDSLRYIVGHLHEISQEYFRMANREYKCGNKAMSVEYSEKGTWFKEKRGEVKTEIAGLVNILNNAKQKVIESTPKKDDSAFQAAKKRFDEAKEKYKKAQAEFYESKSECDRLKATYNEIRTRSN